MGKHIVFIDPNIPEEELKHYGVLGMKWGKRKSSGSSSSNRKSFKGNRIKGTVVKKKVSDMSDDELKNSVNRLRLEGEYRKLTTGSSKSLSLSGREMANKIGTKAIETVATASLVTIGTLALKPHIENLFKK